MVAQKAEKADELIATMSLGSGVGELGAGSSFLCSLTKYPNSKRVPLL